MEPQDIKRIREKFGLTQTELAEVFGDSGPNVVSNIETGFRKPSTSKIQILRLLDSLSDRSARKLISRLREQGQSLRSQA